MSTSSRDTFNHINKITDSLLYKYRWNGYHICCCHSIDINDDTCDNITIKCVVRVWQRWYIFIACAPCYIWKHHRCTSHSTNFCISNTLIAMIWRSQMWYETKTVFHRHSARIVNIVCFTEQRGLHHKTPQRIWSFGVSNKIYFFYFTTQKDETQEIPCWCFCCTQGIQSCQHWQYMAHDKDEYQSLIILHTRRDDLVSVLPTPAG